MRTIFNCSLLQFYIFILEVSQNLNNCFYGHVKSGSKFRTLEFLACVQYFEQCLHGAFLKYLCAIHCVYSAPIISPEQFWWRRADSLSFPPDVISFFHTSRSIVITCRFNKNIPLPAYTTSNKMETSHSSSWSLYFITSNLLPPFPFTRTVAKETP